MAIATKVIFTYQDAKGKIATTEVKIPIAFSLPDMIEFAKLYAPILELITTGKLRSINICVGVDFSLLSLRATALANSDVEEKGDFQFQTAGGFFTSMQVPTLDESIVLPNTDILDPADAGVTAFTNAMVDGILLGDLVTTVNPTDTREDDITTQSYARETFRSSGSRR